MMGRSWERSQRLSGELSANSRLIGASPRTAQQLIGALLTRGLFAADSPKGALRLGFPADAPDAYFPNLYPAGADWPGFRTGAYWQNL